MQHQKELLFSIFLFSFVYGFSQTGNVGIGIDTPLVKLHVAGKLLADTLILISDVTTISTGRTEKITVQNGSVYARALGEIDSNKGFLLGEGNGGPAFGFVYNGAGAGNQNKAYIKEMIGGDTSVIMTFKGDGQVDIGENSSQFSDSDFFEIHTPQGNNPINIYSGGLSKFRINATGRTEINSDAGTDPLQVKVAGFTKLRVHDNGGTAIGSFAQAPENGLFVSGNVGIGNSNPLEKLEVTGNFKSTGTITSTGDFIQVQDGNQSMSLVPNATEGYIKLDVGGSGHSQDDIILGESGGGNLNKVGIGTSSPGSVISNALLEVNGGHIALANNYGIFSNHSSGTGIGAGFDTDTNDDLLLFAGGANRMTINENGHVGIATSAPEYPLHIEAPGTSGQTISLLIESAVSKRPVILFSEASSNHTIGNGMSIEYDGTGSETNNKLRFNKAGGNAAMTIENGGDVGINTTTPSALLHLLQPNSSSGGGLRFEEPDGNFWDLYLNFQANDLDFHYNGLLKSYIRNSDGAYIQISDLTLKQDIEQLELVLAKTRKLRPVSYRYKSHPDAEKSIGFIAQEVALLFPEVVSENHGIKAINYDAFSVIAIQAIKELVDQNVLQQETIERLEEKNDLLESRMARIEKLLGAKIIE